MKIAVTCVSVALAVSACREEGSLASATASEEVAAPELDASSAPLPAVEPPLRPASATATPASAEASQVLTLSAVGDCTLGDPAGTERAPGSFHRAHDDAGGDPSRPFSGTYGVLASDDLTIANLEGTLTTAKCREDLPFAFRGRPAFAQMLVLGSVDVVDLANNHSFDCGSVGLRDTRANLAAAGIGWFGLGDVDVRVVKGIEVRNLGFLGGNLDVKAAVEKRVRSAKRDDNLVVVSFHWGVEGVHATTGVQQSLGRAAIEAGADLVLGHHPHVLQGIEDFRGRKIVYSLGNFVFGGHGHPEDIDAMIFQARFTKKEGKVVPVGYEVIPVAISGNPHQNDFRPILLEGEDAVRVRKDVETYSAKLSTLTAR